jgi:hypothetical protein
MQEAKSSSHLKLLWGLKWRGWPTSVRLYIGEERAGKNFLEPMSIQNVCGQKVKGQNVRGQNVKD